ncbi:uncharacterized protein LOC113852129 [Abrus precatorius]|uniref:Uncharacterized protein LOC113852129 n=1 Tax=Abrus precatorius TaxID=3816 RepID=A0A8B8K3D9_ABRPR|nr:uncharacterized protein LOC113852129 [Abrus precatorius]
MLCQDAGVDFGDYQQRIKALSPISTALVKDLFKQKKSSDPGLSLPAEYKKETPATLKEQLQFSVPKAVISDQGSHFCNRTIAALFQKFGVTHRVATPYHPQTNGQAERTPYRTPLGMSPFRVVFGKACHLPMEIEHRSYWAVKSCNIALEQVGIERKLQLQELDEIRLQAYENSRLYKEKVRRFHDTHILRKEFSVGQKVLLFNSRLKLIAGKLRSRWDGPFVITHVFPHGAVEIQDEATSRTFKVNGHQLKLFQESRPVESAQNIVDLSLVEPTLMEDVSS